MNTENLPTRKNLRALGRYFWPLHFVWWTITQWWTRPSAFHVAERLAVLNLPQVPRYIYVKDKRIDFLRHPFAIGQRILDEKPVGDCEDFAAWRAAWLLRHGHEEVYLLIVKFRRAAHTVVVWWSPDLFSWCWADYGDARPIKGAPVSPLDPPMLRVAQEVEKKANFSPLVGVAYARCHLRSGGLKFGRVKAGSL